MAVRREHQGLEVLGEGPSVWPSAACRVAHALQPRRRVDLEGVLAARLVWLAQDAVGDALQAAVRAHGLHLRHCRAGGGVLVQLHGVGGVLEAQRHRLVVRPAAAEADLHQPRRAERQNGIDYA